jgi:hypothetical protein
MMKAFGVGMAASILLAAAPPPAPARSAPQPAQPLQRPPAPQGPNIPTRVNVRTLLALCGSDNGPCLTYVLGAADAYSSALVAAGRPQVFCFPAGTANQQIAQSAVQYLRARPQEGNNSAALGLLAAFSTIYPCPR